MTKLYHMQTANYWYFEAISPNSFMPGVVKLLCFCVTGSYSV